MKRKILSILLIFSMMCSYCTSTVFAAGNPTIIDNIKNNGRLTVEGGTAPYTWEMKTSKEKTYTGVTYTEFDSVGANMATDGSWINVALTNGGITENYYVTYKVTDADGKTATFNQKEYASQLLNGSFETPSVGRGSYIQSDVGTSGLYWNTTADEKRIEIAKASSSNLFFGVDTTVDGNQFAELNCEEIGSLYQDVLTTPGTTLSWSFAHRARLQCWGGGDTEVTYFTGEDTMALVIVSSETMNTIKTQQDIINVVNNPKQYNAYVLKHSAGGQWSTVSGNYVVPANQYLTRFFFVSISEASNDKTVGNLIDNVKFTTEVTPVEGKAQLNIKKEATSDTEGLNYPTPTILIYDTNASGEKNNLRWTVNPQPNGSKINLVNIEKGTYYIEEVNADIIGYNLTTTFKVGTTVSNTFTVTEADAYKTIEITVSNHYTKEKTSIPVMKVWDDAQNNDNVRPGSVTVKLLADGNETGRTLELNATNNWEGIFDNLDKFNGENEIDYTVEEVEVDGYTPSVDINEDGVYVITNTYNPATITISGEKTWIDDNNRDNVRPSEITVILLANGNEHARKTVSATDNWKYTFDNLPKYLNGNEISYSIQEISVENYITRVDGYNLINTHDIELTSVSGTKTWVGDENTSYRPENITITLFAGTTQLDLEPTWTKDGNVWTYKFENLPKYSNGNEIQYHVAETDVPYYTKSQDGYNFTNTLNVRNEGYGELTIQKIDGSTGLPLGGVEFVLTDSQGNEVLHTTTSDGYIKFTNLAADKYTLTENTPDGYEDTQFKWNVTVDESYTVKLNEKTENNVIIRIWKWLVGTDRNSYFYEYDGQNNQLTIENYPTGSVVATKYWRDGNNQDGIRPTELELTLYADGDEVKDVEATVTHKDDNTWIYTWENLPTYKDGKKIEYTVKENKIPDGYRLGSTDHKLTVVNIHDPEMTQVSGHKIWDDENDNDRKRPDTITVSLIKNDTEVVETVTVGKEDNWSWEFIDLPVYENGQRITYSVREDKVENYTTSYDDEYNITNTYITEKVDIDVKKVWNDEDDHDDIRPTEIIVYLTVNGERSEAQLILSEENEWFGRFEGLEKYNQGEENIYSVEEEEVEGYTAAVEKYSENEFVITNTHTVKANIPETGDNSHIGIWVGVSVASLVALIAVVLSYKKKIAE